MRRLLAFLLFAVIVGMCHRTPTLPHRQEWELYRQANSPDALHCKPPLMPYYLLGDDGRPIFLECMRPHEN